MSFDKQDYSSLFEVLSTSRCKPEQVARWRGRKSPTYKLLRKPLNLEELNEYDHSLAIWRENETLTYIAPRGSYDSPELDYDSQRALFLSFGDTSRSIHIVGKTDDAIAETAAFFMCLKEATEESASSYLSIRGGDFRATGCQWLTHMVDIAPSREINFTNVTLNAAQCTVLATRSHPTKLVFQNCKFEDGGTAFVEALENRESAFGSIQLDLQLAINNVNLKRLLQVHTIDDLGLSAILASNELTLLPFSAKVDSLRYDIYSTKLLQVDVQSLNIVATKLSLCIHHESDTFPTETALSVFQRLEKLGHFEELKITFCLHNPDIDTLVPDCLVQGLIRVARANASLKVLDMSGTSRDSNWEPHMSTLFNGLKDHKGLRTFKVSVQDENEAFGPDFSHLRLLLSRKRNITVTDQYGLIYSDGDSIDKLYALNRFYLGSAGLLVEPPLERPALVTTAFVESSLNDFQRSGLLVSDHLDLFCELIQFAQLDEF